MTSIELTSISGILPPYTVYACDIYGSFCIPIATIFSILPPSNTIILPPAFAFAPAVGIKIVGSGCEHFEVYFCTDLFPENLCFVYRTEIGPSTYTDLFFDFIIDENINGRPSWVGDILGVNNTLFWTGTEWSLSPTGVTNPQEDLFYGVWDSVFPNSLILSNSYCPSICIILFDGGGSFYPLQFSALQSPTPPTYSPYYEYDDGINEVIVYWDDVDNRWELTVNSVLTATIPTYGIYDTPIGTWVLEPLVSYSSISTVLVCPEDFKQFQNSEYFYFMDGIQYNFQD